MKLSTLDRIIHPTVADDGSVHYSSVMSESGEKGLAVCPMVSNRVIPVIFVPGIMGTNLKKCGSHEPVWTVNSAVSAAAKWSTRGAATRKQLLDPTLTEVDSQGELPKGTTLTEDEMRRRGWGEVSAMSYGDFLVWLENALNDANASTGYGCKGLRAELMTRVIKASAYLSPLSHEEVAMSYRYQFPVHAVGYNWLQSNVTSAQRLKARIGDFIKCYRDNGRMCNKVILVTHSMGGLVARYFSANLGGANDVLGIVHGAMPSTGAAAAYKRVKAGTEGMAGLVLGDDAAEVTAVFAQSPGALQLLPSTDYGTGWLKIRDFDRFVSLPEREPYSEIYLQRGKWWGLINERILNPLDPEGRTVEQDWGKFAELIRKSVEPFHRDISRKFHRNTYVFYGDDPKQKTWGDVSWKRTVRRRSDGSMPNLVPYIRDLRSGESVWDPGSGQQTIFIDGAHPTRALFVLQDADEPGDGTVPRRSGKAPLGQRGVHVCVSFDGFGHEEAYKDGPRPGITKWAKNPERQHFTLWAITKIAYEVRHTAMAYQS